MPGDLFDRGPDSWEVIHTVQSLADRMGERFVLLCGNHEDYLMQPKPSFFQRMAWERVGRGATDRSFKAHGGHMEDAVPWLARHCTFSWQGEEIQCVHAGILVAPIEMNNMYTLVHDHEVVPRNKYTGPLTVVGHLSLDAPTFFAGDGKTTRKLPYGKWLPLPEKGCICIDTGCGKGGRLTAMIVEDGKYLLEVS